MSGSGITIDLKMNRESAAGDPLRGVRTLKAKGYAREVKCLETGIEISAWRPQRQNYERSIESYKPLRQRVIASVRDYFGLEESPPWSTIPRADETEHIMLLGDPGAGKSRTIPHLLFQIANRQPVEAIMIYEPACEFIKRHCGRQRGDVILNHADHSSEARFDKGLTGSLCSMVQSTRL